jgi:hypothetical protein
MMSPKATNRAEEPVEMESVDPALKQALGDFKASVHAWSDAAYARPRSVSKAVVRKSWQLAAGWSLAALLIAGTMSGGYYEHHQRVVAAQRAAERAAEQQRQAALERAQKQAEEDEEMLATVDTAVSREVPAAMEPLAQLSEESTSR